MDALIRRFLRTDVLVVGPTLHGVAAALTAARSGHDTALVMSTTSPAVEIGSSMGAWLSERELGFLPPDLREALRAGADDPLVFEGEPVVLLDQRSALIAVEDLLLDAKVRFFYDAHPVGLLAGEDGTVAGALFGSKAGLAAACAPLVIDCTTDSLLARTSGASCAPGAAAGTISACFLTDTEAWCRAGFAEGIQLVRRGPIAEFRMRADHPHTALELRRAIIRRMAKWNRENPHARFRIERAGDEILFEPFTDQPAERPTGGAARQGRFDGLTVIGPCARDGFAANASQAPQEPYLDCRTGFVPVAEERLRYLCTEPRHPPVAGQMILIQEPSAGVDPFARAAVDGATASGGSGVALSFDDPSFSEPDVERIPVTLPAIPVMQAAQVVIAGGGTSGAVAALEAGRRKLDVICLEKHADLGGVGTIGGVPAYWFGRRTPWFKRLHAELKERVRRLEVPVALALLDMVEESGAIVVPRTPVVGARRTGGTITHVLYAGPLGLAAVEAQAVVDATGDGDVAAIAGADYSYGSERDEITYWCSFGSFHHRRDEASRQYMSVVDQRSLRDTARGIIAGRRMSGVYGTGRYLQHYLASRESRHIGGRTRVTYHDVMMERAFPDAVMACKSNIDIKGLPSSRAALCGYVERSFHQNYEATVPFGALVPAGIDNLLVIGKAYSIGHDALSMARMQPDMMALGAVAAAAARIVADDPRGASTGFSGLDVSALQEALQTAGILLPGDLPHGPLDERVPPDESGLAEVMERLSVKPVEPSEWARILSRPDAARSLLHSRDVITIAALGKQTDRIAATLGDDRANDRLLDRLDAMLEPDDLPGTGELERRHDVPDHGFAPEPVFLVNAIAGTGDERLVPRLRRIAGRLSIDPSVSDHRYSYVHAIARAAELIATPEAGAIAESLMLRPAIRDRLLVGADPRLTSDYLGERWAYLGLCLARGAARCGLRSGYERLAEYVGESRLYLARSARRELVDLLETECGFDVDSWRRAVAARAGQLNPRPYRALHD